LAEIWLTLSLDESLTLGASLNINPKMRFGWQTWKFKLGRQVIVHTKLKSLSKVKIQTRKIFAKGKINCNVGA
jgi:hypothetical protein